MTAGALAKIEALKRIDKDKLVWILFAVFSAIVAFYEWHSSAPTPVPAESSAPETIDTYIPKGHLLVPVDIQNADQLQSLVGPTTVVDLYASGAGHRAQLVGRRLRLLRAPANPQVFAVLIRDTEADRLLNFPGPFRASIRTPDESSHEIVTAQHSLKWDLGGRQ